MWRHAQTQRKRDFEGIPDQEDGSSEFSHLEYEEVLELINGISEEAMEEEIFKRNLNISKCSKRTKEGV